MNLVISLIHYSIYLLNKILSIQFMFKTDSEFECTPGECIPGHLRCSGTVECPDGSDELDCNDDDVDCADGTYRDNGGCRMLKKKECDGTQFDCGSGNCVPLDRVCDRTNDCGQWQDEENCQHLEENNEAEEQKKELCDQCDQLCLKSSATEGFECGCRPGFKLSGKTLCQGKSFCSPVFSCIEGFFLFFRCR